MAISTNPSINPGRADASLDRRGRASGPGPVPEVGAAIEVSHLRKTYGPVVAVDDVSFSVAEGETVSLVAGREHGSLMSGADCREGPRGKR